MKASNIYTTGLLAILLVAHTATVSADDVAKGKKVAKKCIACHTMKEGGKHKLGPNLYDILGKPAGVVEGYKYSDALKNSGIVWDAETFSDFVANPKKVVPGTKMSFRGVNKPTQRVELLAYFATLRSSDTPSQSSGNVADGKTAAEKHCVVCHSFEKGGKKVFGPNLFGIYGQPAGEIKGYNYSDALRKSNLIWNDKNLLEFLSAPEQFIKGTKARFPGLKTAKEKTDILEYMKSLK